MNAATELALIDDEPVMAMELHPAQMELLLGEPVKIDRSKAPFSYTSERLWRDRPDVAKAALKLLAEPRETVPYRRIMKRLHMSYHLLRQLEISCRTEIAKEKKTLGDLAYTATEAFLDRAINEAANPESAISAKDAMIAAGIGSEKYLMFRGEAVGKIEVTHKIDFAEKVKSLHDRIMEKFESMKRATVVEAGVLEIGES